MSNSLEAEYIPINVSRPQEYFLSSFKPKNLFLSGAGGGKSHTGGNISANFIINFPHVRGFIGANTYGQLSKSTLDRIFKVWQDTFGWTEDEHFVVDKVPPEHFITIGPKLKSYANTISFNNGALIFLASLEKYKLIDGTEFAWAILDETKDTREEAVKDVISFRLRQSGIYHDHSINELVGQEPNHDNYTAITPLYVLTSPAKVEWINDWFELGDHYEEINQRIYDKEDFFTLETPDSCVVIASTFHNEHNLRKGFIQDKLREHAGSPHLIDMLVYASPIAKAGGEFIKTFQRLKHVRKIPILEGLPFHITLDFNASPYMTCLVAQIQVLKDRTIVNVVGEICSAEPRNSTEDVCSIWAATYGKDSVGLFYYGDPSGGSRQTVTKEYRDNYDALEKHLRPYLNNRSRRVFMPAPGILPSRDLLNGIFAGTIPIEIYVDASCKNLIKDLEFCKEDKNGKMIKPTTKNPITGITYEKYGHCLDALRYLICQAFEEYLPNG